MFLLMRANNHFMMTDSYLRLGMFAHAYHYPIHQSRRRFLLYEYSVASRHAGAAHSLLRTMVNLAELEHNATGIFCQIVGWLDVGLLGKS